MRILLPPGRANSLALGGGRKEGRKEGEEKEKRDDEVRWKRRNDRMIYIESYLLPFLTDDRAKWIDRWQRFLANLVETWLEIFLPFSFYILVSIRRKGILIDDSLLFLDRRRVKKEREYCLEGALD